jgi:hypothetical protein
MGTFDHKTRLSADLVFLIFLIQITQNLSLNLDKTNTELF